MKSKQKAFTLIELLVVIAIIGLLASIIMVSLSNARAKGRDAKRRADLKQIATALELYYSDFGTYIIVDSVTTQTTGYPGCACGWFSYNYGTGAIGQGLADDRYLASNPHDPGGSDTGSVAGKTGYMMYGCPSLTNSYALWAGLEYPTAEDLANEAAAETTCNDPGLRGAYGVNYVVLGK